MQQTNNTKTIKQNSIGIKNMAHIALCSALISICALITIPVFAVPFTLHTFAIALTLLLLGGKKGTISIFIYILLGTVGLPVFAGFKGGVSALFGMTGGYILGFLFQGITYAFLEIIFCQYTNIKKSYWQPIALCLGLAVCYIFGTIWFVQIYTSQVESISYSAALGMCVFPFILPDISKFALAILVSKRIAKHI